MSAVLVAGALARGGGAGVVVGGVDEAAFFPAHEDVFFLEGGEERGGEEGVGCAFRAGGG